MVLGLLLASTVLAQTEPSQRFAAVLDPWRTDDGPGLAVAIARDGDILFRGSVGLAQLEHAVPIQPETIFHVASVSKQFTCFAISLLAEEGKLSWQDDIRKHLPEVPDFGNPIRLEHLAHHTSGLRDQWELLVLAGWRMDDVITEANVLELVRRQRELNFEPGSQHLYCNTGYTLLARVVQVVSGRPFTRFCRERIFAPLEMRRTHFHDDHRHLVPGRAYSYAPTSGGGFEKRVLSYAIAGPTSLFTTVDDLMIWNANLARPRVGSAAVLETMLERGRLNEGRELEYAKGLFHEVHRGRRVIGHSGGDAGFRSHLLSFPDERIDIAVLSNRADCPTRHIALQLADVLLEGDGPAERPATEVGSPPIVAEPAVAPELVSRRTGLYLDADTGVCWKLAANGSRLEVFSEREVRLAVPISEQHFVSLPPGPAFEIQFIQGSRGPERCEIHERGQSPRSLLRVGPPIRSRDSFRELEGEYRSEELDLSYHIELRGAALFVRRLKYGAELLQPRYEDGFTTGWMNIRFLRDDEDQPLQMLVSTGRVRNLRFHRQAD